MLMSVLVLLHTLNSFLFLYGIREDFHQVDRLHVFILCRLQCIFDPFI